MTAFIDKVQVIVKAGDGGNGIVSFRHEKFVSKGGPDGGDGGDGGDVIFRADNNINTLQSFRYKQRLKADSGKSGGKRKKRGKSGDDLVIKVPVGTQVYNGDDMLADLTTHDQEEIIAKGGKGGFGNAHFTSSTRQAPRVAEKGEKGEEFTLDLELKLLADVGLVGLPNAGKSTLLSVVTNARPEIADYPFTTLSPNLGVADVDDGSLLIADIPGLIAGASEGKGLGDDFLRHIERTAVLLQLVDIHSDNPVDDYKTIDKELADYKIDLSDKPRLLVLSKTDGVDQEYIDMIVSELKKHTSLEIFYISAQSKDGLMDLLRAAKRVVEATRADEEAALADQTDEGTVISHEKDENNWEIVKKTNKWIIKGDKIGRFARRTDIDNEWGVHRLRDIMQKMGIEKELNKQGAKAGDKVVIEDIELEL